MTALEEEFDSRAAVYFTRFTRGTIKLKRKGMQSAVLYGKRKNLDMKAELWKKPSVETNRQDGVSVAAHIAKNLFSVQKKGNEYSIHHYTCANYELYAPLRVCGPLLLLDVDLLDHGLYSLSPSHATPF